MEIHGTPNCSWGWAELFPMPDPAIERIAAPDFENCDLKTVYNACITGRHPLPSTDSNPGPVGKPRRWTIVAAGLWLAALALVVIYTSRGAFFSPLALVVVSAIGLAALLLQLRLRQNRTARIRSPMGLNALGIVFAGAAVYVDVRHSGSPWMLIAALGAVFCFAISGAIVLNGMRKNRI